MIFFPERPGSKKGEINIEIIEECEFHTVYKSVSVSTISCHLWLQLIDCNF